MELFANVTDSEFTLCLVEHNSILLVAHTEITLDNVNTIVHKWTQKYAVEAS